MADFEVIPPVSPIDTDVIPLKQKPNEVQISYNEEEEEEESKSFKANNTNLEDATNLLIAKSDANYLEDDYVLEYLDRNKQSRAKSLFVFFKPKIVTMVQLTSRGLALIDMVTDINLLYKSQLSSNGALTVCLFLSIVSPYLLQYSCGIKLFTLNRTFERLKGLKKLFVVLFLLPFGVLFFVFLDLFDIFFNFYVVVQLLFCCSSLVDIQRTEEDVAAQLGMDRMNWEGIKRQKKVSQLMFESIPQVTLQCLLFFEIIPGVLEITGGITAQDILISTISALANTILEIFKLFIESKAVEEGFFNYTLTCFMARIGWIPFRRSIRKFLENQNAKLAYISYNIRFMFVSVDFFFSELTIHQFIETLLIRPIKKDGYDSILIIDFHESLRLLTVSSLVELLRTCSERHIFIKGLNDNDKLNWNNAVLGSMDNNNDVRIISNSRDSQGTSHLVTIYKSEKILQKVYASPVIQKQLKHLSTITQSKDEDYLKIAWLPTIFSQCIGLDFDVNISSLQTGETLVFELIKNNDYNNLWYLLNEYQTTRNCDVYLDIRNKKGKSPLFYALQQYITTKTSKRKQLKNKIKTKKRKTTNEKYSNLTPNSPGPQYGALDEVDGTMFNIASNISQLNRAIHTNNFSDIELADMTRNLSNDDNNININNSGNVDKNDNKMYMLLLKSGSDPNFPVSKKSGLTQSPLGFLLEAQKLDMILELIPFDAELNSKEIVKLSSLFLPKWNEKIDDWKERKYLLVKICTKLQIPLDYIRDENACNPLHLLLRSELFYSHPALGFFIRDLQNTSLNWMFQHDVNGNLPLINILRDNDPNINVFKMVFDNAPTDSHRHRLITILKSNRYTMGILLYFIVNETRKLVQFISCKENKALSNQLRKIFTIFGNDIRWNAADHDPDKYKAVKQWLKNINKQIYLDLFISNDINTLTKVKQTITKSYLIEIGMSNGHDINDIIDSIASLNINGDNDDEKINKDLVDLSIVTVLAQDISFDDYMRYKIATKLRNEFNLSVSKTEEILLIKWNKKAHEKSVILVEQQDALKLDGRSNIITEMRNWIGRIDKQITKQITKRQQKYVMGRSPTGVDDAENERLLQEIKEEEEEEEEEEGDNARGTIISLGELRRQKTRKTVQQNTFIVIFWKRLELIYAFMIEGLSVMDLMSDIVILLQLIQSPEQWWTAWMLLFLLAPYLVSFCALASIFQSQKSADGGELNKFVILMFLSPLSVLFLLILDIVFMLYVIIALIFTIPLLMCCCNVACVDSDWIFRLFGMSHMEIKGYRRLRTLSQLIFESLPQVILQTRMLYALQFEGNSTNLNVSANAVIVSVIIAAIHFLLEVTIISAEASATRVTLFQYGINCLNARLNWVPLSHLLSRHHRDYQQRQRQKQLRKRDYKKKKKKKKVDRGKQDYNVLNFEQLSHGVCGINYVVHFEFSSSALRRLAGHVTRMQKYVDLSSNDVNQIDSLLAHKYSSTPRIILGEKSCANLNLSDLAVLYRNSAHRLLIEGGNDLKWESIVSRHFDGNGNESFEIKKVKFLFHDFLIHGELKAIHLIYSAIEAAGEEYMDQIPIQELKRSLLSLQTDGGICKDIATLRRFWQNKYMFGLQCKETHQIYKVILGYYEKALTLYQSMSVSVSVSVDSADQIVYNDNDNDEFITKQLNNTLTDQYHGILNMILLILWYSQGTILSHRCPQCNISWREYIDKNTKSQYRINLIKQLPQNVKIFVKSIKEERSGIFNQNKKIKTTIKPQTVIPFILCECSDRFARKIDDKLMKHCTRIGDKLFNFDDEDDSNEKIRSNAAIWLWLDIDEKDSTGTYHKYEDIVNKDINQTLEIMLNTNRNLKKQKTVQTTEHDKNEEDEIEILKFRNIGSIYSIHDEEDNPNDDRNNNKNKDVYDENTIYIQLTKGRFALDEHGENGDFFLKVDMNVYPNKYYQITIKDGKEIKSKPVKRVTKENSINMVILKDSNSVSDNILSSLKQANIDMLSTVIENKHDSTSSYIIMKNLYKQNLLTDLLLTAMNLKLRHGYDQVLVAISRFFRKKSINSSYNQKGKRINFTFDYFEIEDNLNKIEVLGIDVINIILQINNMNTDEINDQEITLWMKIPNENKRMLNDWNNVLICTQKIDKSDLNKAIKFNCHLQEHYALGYFNPSLLNKNASNKKIEFYIEMAADIGLHQVIQSKLKVIINQTISESKFEKVHKKYTKEHSIPKWQYVADKQWINYEQSTCIQMEEDLKKILKKRTENEDMEKERESNATIIIPIKAGSYFGRSRNKNTYQIRIVCSVYPPRYYQLNIKTGHTRLVKQDPPYWLQDPYNRQLQDPYIVKWKYQCRQLSGDDDDDDDDDAMEDVDEAKQTQYIYVDITSNINAEEKEELPLQERIEGAYEKRVNRFAFGDKTIHFNYDSIPHTFLETDNETNEIQKVIRQKPLYLRQKKLNQDLIIKNGPFWELLSPCSSQLYQELISDENTTQCLLCKCNMFEWEVLENQSHQLHEYKTSIAAAAVAERAYDLNCEYLRNNTIVSLSSQHFFHTGCITEHFESQLSVSNSEQILKCPNSNEIVYDSAADKQERYALIGSQINENYEMIINKDENKKQIQILFVFGSFVSPVTHAINDKDVQLLQNYKDAFRRRLIRIDKSKNIIYIGKNAKLINVFKQILDDDGKEDDDDENESDADFDEHILDVLVSDVIMQKTITYGDEEEEEEAEDDLDIAAMIDNELDLSAELSEDRDGQHYNTQTVKFIDEKVDP